MPKNSNQRNGSLLYWSTETWAFLSLRLFLALRFITAGLGKFDNDGYSFSNLYDGWVANQISTFGSKTNLPAFLYSPYLHSLAYVEIVLGFLLLAGVKTKYTLALISLTYVSLGYGLMLLGNPNPIGTIGIYILLSSAALYFVRHNKFELLR